MIKKVSLRVALSCVLALLTMFSFLPTKVFAEDTKSVTVTVHQNITAPDTAINNILQSISNSTYGYDDGSFKGTLSYSGISNFSATYVTSYPGVTLYRFEFDVTYSGTVTKYEPIQSITVNQTVPQSIIAPDYAINNILSSFTTSTRSYDDGTFRGTLYYTGVSSVSSSYYASYPGVTLYRFTFDVYYSGTATRY